MSTNKGWQEIYTPANLVTIIRILLVPAFIILMLAPWASWMPEPALAVVAKPWIAAFVFILLAASDGLDGYLARSRGEVTTFGKLLDPIADKILVAAALLALIELGKLPAWIALVILGREFLVSGLRMVAAAQGKVVAASNLGKAKTIFQIVAVVTLILKDSLISLWHLLFGDSFFGTSLSWLMNTFASIVVGLTLIITIGSLIDYFLNSADVLGFERSGRWLKKDKSMPGDLSATQAELSNACIRQAEAAHKTLGTAESCTGGLVAAALTEIPGSSAAFKGSVVSYANEVKSGLLGVTDEILANDGAVSEACVRQMALSLQQSLNVDLAVAISGIAGPDGGSAEKPVGTVWLAVASKDQVLTRVELFDGNRSEIRKQAVNTALAMLLEALYTQ